MVWGRQDQEYEYGSQVVYIRDSDFESTKKLDQNGMSNLELCIFSIVRAYTERDLEVVPNIVIFLNQAIESGLKSDEIFELDLEQYLPYKEEVEKYLVML